MSFNINALTPIRIYTKFKRKKRNKIKTNISGMENHLNLDKDNNMEELVKKTIKKKKGEDDNDKI